MIHSQPTASHPIPNPVSHCYWKKSDGSVLPCSGTCPEDQSSLSPFYLTWCHFNWSFPGKKPLVLLEREWPFWGFCLWLCCPEGIPREFYDAGSSHKPAIAPWWALRRQTPAKREKPWGFWFPVSPLSTKPVYQGVLWNNTHGFHFSGFVPDSPELQAEMCLWRFLGLHLSCWRILWFFTRHPLESL